MVSLSPKVRQKTVRKERFARLYAASNKENPGQVYAVRRGAAPENNRETRFAEHLGKLYRKQRREPRTAEHRYHTLKRRFCQQLEPARIRRPSRIRGPSDDGEGFHQHGGIGSAAGRLGTGLRIRKEGAEEAALFRLLPGGPAADAGLRKHQRGRGEQETAIGKEGRKAAPVPGRAAAGGSPGGGGGGNGNRRGLRRGGQGRRPGRGEHWRILIDHDRTGLLPVRLGPGRNRRQGGDGGSRLRRPGNHRHPAGGPGGGRRFRGGSREHRRPAGGGRRRGGRGRGIGGLRSRGRKHRGARGRTG